MRLSPTTCGPNLTRRWRSRRSSWALRRHGSAQRWRRWGDGSCGCVFTKTQFVFNDPLCISNNRNRSRRWTNCVQICWRSSTTLVMTGMQKVQVSSSPGFSVPTQLQHLKCSPVFPLYVPALRQNKPSFNPADTNALVGAVAFGKGLSKCRPPGPVAPGHPGQGQMMSGGPTLQQVTIGGAPGQQGALGGAVAPQQQGQPGRTAVQLGQYYAWVLSLLFIFYCIFILIVEPLNVPGLPVHVRHYKIHSLATSSGTSVRLHVNAKIKSANHSAAATWCVQGDNFKRSSKMGNLKVIDLSDVFTNFCTNIHEEWFQHNVESLAWRSQTLPETKSWSHPVLAKWTEWSGQWVCLQKRVNDI